jgi:3-oxoacyl-[acyl-carrier protein] reductase
MLAVNLTGVFHCCQSVLRYMLREKRGNIINISSIWGVTGASCEVHYSAAKAGVIGLTKALAKELAPSGIRVNCIAPGVIQTDMLSGLSSGELQTLADDTPLGRLGTPRDAAHCALFLADEKSGFITGQVVSPNGGYVI